MPSLPLLRALLLVLGAAAAPQPDRVVLPAQGAPFAGPRLSEAVSFSAAMPPVWRTSASAPEALALPPAPPISVFGGGPAAAVDAGAQAAAPAGDAWSPAFDGAYPPARRDDVVDDYHGVKVADPYRWTEDAGSDDTKKWIERQNALTRSKLDALPDRAAIEARLRELSNYERRGVPSRRGGHWFYTKNSGLQDHDVLYRSKSILGAAEPVLDLNTIDPSGLTSLTASAYSPDGRYLAYAVSHAGSDRAVWKLRDVDAGRDLPYTLEHAHGHDVAWTSDGRGFYYTSATQASDAGAWKLQVRYHVPGTAPEKDAVAFERAKPWFPAPSLTRDGRFLLIDYTESTAPLNRVYLKELATGREQPLFSKADAHYDVVDNEGDVFYVLTSKDAPRRRLVAVDRRKPRDLASWRDVIPQGAPNETLDKVVRFGAGWAATWIVDARHALRLYGLDGSFQREIELPAPGTVHAVWSNPSKRRGDRRRGYFMFSSFNHPVTVFRFDPETGKKWKVMAHKPPIDPSRFDVTQEFVQSSGARVPMWVAHRKGVKLDGSNDAYAYGYGGFGIPFLPYYSSSIMWWLERGVYGLVNLRGGGEYGRDWHDDGRQDRKQNVFDDFIAASEHLIARGYTTSARLSIGGGSNGGTLIGSVLTQRPELFGAAVPEVGVLDMLRYEALSGPSWMFDYGTVATPEGFKTLFGYSPVQNVKPAVYPATMVMTGSNDDRVPPTNSHKLAAALQAAQQGDQPVLERIEMDSGHGQGLALNRWLKQVADRWAFITHALRGGFKRPG